MTRRVTTDELPQTCITQPTDSHRRSEMTYVSLRLDIVQTETSLTLHGPEWNNAARVYSIKLIYMNPHRNQQRLV